MHERAEAIHAELKVISQSGLGTRLLSSWLTQAALWLCLVKFIDGNQVISEL